MVQTLTHIYRHSFKKYLLSMV